MNNGEFIIPYNAEESFAMTVFGQLEARDLAKWAVDYFDHVVVNGDHKTSLYNVWAWTLSTADVMNHQPYPDPYGLNPANWSYTDPGTTSKTNSKGGK